MLVTLLLSGLLGGLVSAPKAAPAQVAPAVVRPNPLATTTISGDTVTPATITFTATNPTGTPVVSGSAAAVVTWKTGTPKGGAWTLTVNSSGTDFSSCTTVPASAVTVTCSSVTGGTAGACSGATALSTSATQVAGGTEGAGTTTYTVNLGFTLADSWKYIASSLCSLSLAYTITAK